MKILAIDYGLQRIGVAVGDTKSGIAFVRDVVIRDGNEIKRIAQLLKSDHIEMILVGLPLKRDHSPGDIQEDLDAFISQLESSFALPIETFDERYSSRIAQQKLSDLGLSEKSQRGILDSHAALVILQEWLDISHS